MEYDANSTALLVVDMQNDFCHPDGTLYAEGSEEVISNINEVIDWAYNNHIPVNFTLDTHEEWDPEFEQWGPHCIKGSWGHKIHSDIRRVNPAHRFPKSTYDAFYNTDLDESLETRGINTLIICGTLANVCVQETASSAALRGYDVEVIEDAVGYIEEEQRRSALEHIDFLIGDLVSMGDL